jgi:hypothetical protein
MKSGSLEARLLRSSPGFEPPAHAQDEVWQRLKGLGAAGAAVGAFGLGGHAAAAAGKVGGKALWLWAAGVGLAVAVPAAAVATYWVGHRAPRASKVAVVAATPGSAAPSANDTAGQPAPEAAQTPVLAEAPLHEPARSRSASHALPSALKAESRLLAAARAKFAAGDPAGALDDVARLAAQFPHGELLQEREVVAIDCLEALGDRTGTRARALAFRERFPNSPYTAHVRSVLSP